MVLNPYLDLESCSQYLLKLENFHMTSYRHTDLVLALSKQKDIDRLRELCRGRKIPAENRADVWKVVIKSCIAESTELLRCKCIEK